MIGNNESLSYKLSCFHLLPIALLGEKKIFAFFVMSDNERFCNDQLLYISTEITDAGISLYVRIIIDNNDIVYFINIMSNICYDFQSRSSRTHNQNTYLEISNTYLVHFKIYQQYRCKLHNQADCSIHPLFSE